MRFPVAGASVSPKLQVYPYFTIIALAKRHIKHINEKLKNNVT